MPPELKKDDHPCTGQNCLECHKKEKERQVRLEDFFLITADNEPLEKV